MADRPNLLLICTDQQSSTAMGCAGHDAVATPAMDALAAAGLRFTRAYCTQPLCAPQRACFVTGRMPHDTGAVDNTSTLDEELAVAALGNLLAGAGYRCGLAGKWHVPGLTPRACGFQVLAGARDDEVPAAAARFFHDPGPFFLFVSLTNPHDVCQAARHQPLPQGPVPEPQSLAACPNLPANAAEPPYGPEVLRFVRRHNPRIYPTDRFTPDDWRRLRWDYLRLVEKVDAEVGRVLTALTDAGREGDTLVWFTSDHGEGAGAHGWNQKTALWEEVVRVPLIARGPEVRSGATEDRLVSTGVDLLPTLCAAAGVPVPDQVDGRSLTPLLNQAPSPGTARTEDTRAGAPGPGITPAGDGAAARAQGPAAHGGATGGDAAATNAWRSEVVVETVTPLGEGPGGLAAGRALVGERFKYSVYALGRYREQFVDLQADPGEMVNLAAEARYAQALQAYRERLRARCEASGDTAGARLIP